MVYPERTEYYDRYDKRFLPNAQFGGKRCLVSPGKKIVDEYKNEIDLTKKAWLDYYKHIYEDEYGLAYDEMHATAIRSYCKSHGVPLILCTIKKKEKCKTKYDIYCADVPKHENGHPTEQGHAIHAQMILDYHDTSLSSKSAII